MGAQALSTMPPLLLLRTPDKLLAPGKGAEREKEMNLSTGTRMTLFSIAALVIVCLAGVLSAHSHSLEAQLFALTALPALLFGAVTVTYEYPVAGTTAPTAAQSANANIVRANVIATADADTTATITHNFGTSAGDLAAGRPIVILEPLLQASAGLSLWAFTSKTTNTVVCTKSTAVGSGNAGAQIRVHVLRPHSIIE